MMEKIILKGNGLTSGIAEGEAIVTKQPFNFLATYMRGFMLSQSSSIVGDIKHELFGKDIGGKVLVFPHSIGSLACGVTLLEAMKRGVGPKAIVSVEIESAVLSGAVFADLFFNLPLPIVDKLDRNPLEVIETGDHVRVDADKGIVSSTSPPPLRLKDFIDIHIVNGISHHAHVTEALYYMKKHGVEEWVKKQDKLALCLKCGKTLYWFARNCQRCGAQVH